MPIDHPLARWHQGAPRPQPFPRWFFLYSFGGIYAGVLAAVLVGALWEPWAGVAVFALMWAGLMVAAITVSRRVTAAKRQAAEAEGWLPKLILVAHAIVWLGGLALVFLVALRA